MTTVLYMQHGQPLDKVPSSALAHLGPDNAFTQTVPSTSETEEGCAAFYWCSKSPESNYFETICDPIVLR